MADPTGNADYVATGDLATVTRRFVTDPYPMLPKPKYLGPGIHTAHRTRRDRRCDSCGEPIPKGTLYVRHALPPNSELGNVGWQRLDSCGWTTGDCRRYWEIDAKDLAGEPHVIPT